MANPFTTSSSDSSNPFGGAWKITSDSPSTGDLTARQLALLLQLQKRDKHFSLGGLLKGAGKRSLNPVLWTFDKLMRPAWAVSGALNEGVDYHKVDVGGALSGAWKGFSGKERMGIGEVLGNKGVLKGHGRIRGALGFTADVATDPLMLLSAGAAPFTGGGSVAAYTALKTGAKEVGEAALHDAAKKAAYDAGRQTLEGKVTPDVLEILQQAGPAYKARLALAKQVELDATRTEAEGVLSRELPETWFAQRAAAKEVALAEERRVTPRGLQLRYGTRKHNIATPVTIAGKRVAPRIPKVADIGGRNIPIVSHLVDATGKRFIPGYKREELHALELSRQHYAESGAVTQRNAIAKIMEGGEGPGQAGLTKEIRALGHDEQLHALHMFEQPLKMSNGRRWKAVIKKGDSYVVNPKYVSHLIKMGEAGDPMGITRVQGEFVRRFHNATQYLYARDQAAGVIYKGEHLGERGRIYVPHLMDRSGDSIVPTQGQKNILSEAGFQKKRAKSNISLSQIHELVKKGDLPNTIETDPYKLLTHTSRARAEKQADMAMIRATEAYAGIPTRLIDKEAVSKAIKRDKAAGRKLRAAQRQMAHAEEAIQSKAPFLAEHVISDFTERIDKIEKLIRKVKFGKLDNRKVATAIKRATDEYESAIKKLERDIKTKVTKATNAASKARTAADKAEAHAEAAIAKGTNKSWITRSTHIAATKMDVAEKLEERLAALPRVISAEQHAALAATRDKAIATAKATGRLNQKRTKNATIAVMQNRVKRLEIERDAQLVKITNGTHPVLKKILAEPKLSFRTAKEALAEAKAEQRLANKAVTRATKGRRNPAYSGKVHTKVPKSTDEWGNQYAYPKEVAQSIERLRKITSGDEVTVESFAKGYSRLLATWKLLVTSVNPGYRLRNSMTDFWNMWVSGVPAHAIPIYGRRAAQVMIRAKKGDLEAMYTIIEASTHGVMSGLYTGDVQAVAQFLKYAGHSYKSKNLPKSYIKLAQDFNRNAENWGRLTHYLYQTEGRHIPASEAAMKVKLAHFDYEDLTPFEQKIMKNIFPFYTWTRKNIPFQVKMIAQHPGRYAAFPKAAQEAEYASGNNPGAEIPGYMSDNFAFAIGKNRYLNPQFGVSDLAPLQGPSQAYDRVKSMITPAIKTPVELMTNKSLFSGQPIVDDKHPRAPVNALGAGLLSLLPGSDVGQTQRGGISGPGANPYYAYLLSQIPAARTAFVSTGGIKGKSAGTNSLLSYLGGLSTTVVDPEAQKSFMTQDAQAEADRLIQGLRDAGLIPPARKRKRTKKDLFIENQTFG